MLAQTIDVLIGQKRSLESALEASERLRRDQLTVIRNRADMLVTRDAKIAELENQLRQWPDILNTESGYRGSERSAALDVITAKDARIAELKTILAEKAKETASDMKPPAPVKNFPAGALKPPSGDPRRIGS